MKYDKELFEVSKTAYNYMQINNNPDGDVDVNKIKARLFKTLVQRFKDDVASGNVYNSKGVLRAAFLKDLDDTKTSSGYNDIHKLLFFDEFDSFAQEYCIYINTKSLGQKAYELIWDYKTYFEQNKVIDNMKKTM